MMEDCGINLLMKCRLWNGSLGRNLRLCRGCDGYRGTDLDIDYSVA